ncbi:MAG: TetR/AcrR family transcriptional regulator [Pseudomonadota bacterium]
MEIIEGAKAVLREQGIAAFTTSTVAKRAGIPVGSLYQYFPNKTAVLVALYEDYLGGIRAIYDAYEKPEVLALGWRAVLERMGREVFLREDCDGIVEELGKAVGLYPDLWAVDTAHRDKTAERVASILRKLGSRWQMRRLKRLVLFVYAMNNGVWAYRSEFHPQRKELQVWQWRVLEGAFSQAFDQ